MDKQKFPSEYLQLIFDCGMIARSIDSLYDKKNNGSLTKIIIGYGKQSIDLVIKAQEERLENALIKLQGLNINGS